MYKTLAYSFFFLLLHTGLSGQTTRTATQSSRIHYYEDTAREPEAIQSEYPYDISLRTAKSDTITSDLVLQKNGKPTVLLFWLTTCPPCRAELKAVAAKYTGWQAEADFNLYAISTDWPRNADAFIQRVEQSNWPFPAYHDYRREFSKIMPGNLNGLPQVFVLDANGKIIHHKRKYMPGDEDKWFEVVKSLVK